MVNQGLAHVSDLLFATAIAVYVISLVAFCAEWAFSPRRLGGAEAGRAADAGVLVGVGAAGAAARFDTVPDSAADSADSADSMVDTVVDADRPAGAGPGDGRPPVDGPIVSWRSSEFVSSGALSAWAGRVSMGAVLLGALVHLGSIVARGAAAHRAPWGNMYEFTSAAGIVGVAAFVLLAMRVPKARQLGMFVMFPVVVLMFLAGTVLYAKAGPLVAALRSYWLYIHVAAAIIATGIFMVSAVATMLYLVRERYERHVAAGTEPTRLPVSLGGQLPPSATLDTLAYRTVAFGFPIFTFGIICGAIWAEAAWGRYWGWDPKETWAFIAWVIYAGYLHARATAGWKGVKAARINMLGFGAMIFNFFVINIVVSGLHSYAGL